VKKPPVGTPLTPVSYPSCWDVHPFNSPATDKLSSTRIATHPLLHLRIHLRTCHRMTVRKPDPQSKTHAEFTRDTREGRELEVVYMELRLCLGLERSNRGTTIGSHRPHSSNTMASSGYRDFLASPGCCMDSPTTLQEVYTSTIYKYRHGKGEKGLFSVF
jgi:hypothetical protein